MLPPTNAFTARSQRSQRRIKMASGRSTNRYRTRAATSTLRGVRSPAAAVKSRVSCGVTRFEVK